MKKAVLVVGLFFVLAGRAEASWLSNSWEYVVSPVNCLAQLGREVIVVTTNFVKCVAGNVNRNPATLNTLIQLP